MRSAISIVKYLGLVFAGITLCTGNTSLRLQKGQHYSFGNFLKRINGSILNKTGSVLSRTEVDDDTECASLCVLNKLCLSVNFGVGNKTSKVHCELLSWGATSYREFLNKKDGFFHMRMENICTKNPCEKPKECVPHLESSTKPYTCVCPTDKSCRTARSPCTALGIEDGSIKDSQMTASSVWNIISKPHYARLHRDSTWLPLKGASANSWLKVDFLRRTRITGVATQGRYNYSYWTTSYVLLFIDNGSTVTYQEGGITKVFPGNVDRHGVVKHELANPVVARQVIIQPKAWHLYVALRLELYGCYV